MPNLIEDLSPAYVNDNFRGVYFLHAGKLHTFRRCTRDALETFAVDAARVTHDDWVPAMIPFADISDFSFFKYPRLGYRNVRSDFNGSIAVVNLALRRSTRRGFVLDNVSADSVTPAITGENNVWEEVRNNTRLDAVFNPVFPSFRDTLTHLLEGETLGAALSPDAALVLATDRSPESEFVILFRGRVVGTVDVNGNLDLTNKAARRGHLMNLLAG